MEDTYNNFNIQMSSIVDQYVDIGGAFWRALIKD